MEDFDAFLARMEELLRRVEDLDEGTRSAVFELLDRIDALHRTGLRRIEETLEPAALERLRTDPAASWMLDAYGIGVDERAAADRALESIRPYIHSHGGRVEVLDVTDGVVGLRMSGACAGCSASAITLQQGVEEALRENFPAFVRIEVEEQDAEPHPPPGPTLIQIEGLRRGE